MLQHQIPRAIKINVLRRWLNVQSRDQIAKEEGISTGSVSNIIKEYRQNDSKFDLLRQVALILRSKGYTTESFACLDMAVYMLAMNIETWLDPCSNIRQIPSNGGQMLVGQKKKLCNNKHVLLIAVISWSYIRQMPSY